MRAIIVLSFVCIVSCIDGQSWKHPQNFMDGIIWTRKGRASIQTTQDASRTTATIVTQRSNETMERTETETDRTIARLAQNANTNADASTIKIKYTTPLKQTISLSTKSATTLVPSRVDNSTEMVTADLEISTFLDTTTQETGTTEEPRDNHRLSEFYLSKREKPQVKIASNISQNLLPLPAAAGAALVKPTKYHYYPHNQHIYLLPECAIQQVCNAVYVRLNWTQPLCACPSRYRDPCSASLNSDDQHTTELTIGQHSKALTLVKTCEPTAEMRICRAPRDWSLLALQNIRTGKSHYLVICRCTDTSILEGPMSHDQPTYASVPGIRVYGMMCVQTGKRKSRPLRKSRSSATHGDFPWNKVDELMKTIKWD